MRASVAQPSASTVESKPLSRREFLYYIGGASVTMTLAGACGLVSAYLQPAIRYGAESGIFLLEQNIFPEFWSAPVPFSDQETFGSGTIAYFVMMEEGLLALDAFCSFRHETRVIWVESWNFLVCPWCGTRYQIDGTYVSGASRRGLDRFVLEVRMPNGTVVRTPSDGSPISVEGAESIVLNTTQIIPGAPRS